MAKKPKISIALLYVASFFCLANGRKYFLAEAKPKIISTLAENKFTAYPVKNTKLLAEKIPPEGLPYYQTDPPRLYMFDLKAMIKTAADKVAAPAAVEFEFPYFV